MHNRILVEFNLNWKSSFGHANRICVPVSVHFIDCPQDTFLSHHHRLPKTLLNSCPKTIQYGVMMMMMLNWWVCCRFIVADKYWIRNGRLVCRWTMEDWEMIFFFHFNFSNWFSHSADCRINIHRVEIITALKPRNIVIHIRTLMAAAVI